MDNKRIDQMASLTISVERLEDGTFNVLYPVAQGVYNHYDTLRVSPKDDLRDIFTAVDAILERENRIGVAPVGAVASKSDIQAALLETGYSQWREVSIEDDGIIADAIDVLRKDYGIDVASICLTICEYQRNESLDRSELSDVVFVLFPGGIMHSTNSNRVASGWILSPDIKTMLDNWRHFWGTK